jgi:hypothetical protein
MQEKIETSRLDMTNVKNGAPIAAKIIMNMVQK